MTQRRPVLVFHNGQFDRTVLNGEWGLPLGRWCDTMLREHAIDPGATKGLGTCAARRLVMPPWKAARGERVAKEGDE